MTRWRTVAWVRPAIAAMTLLLVSAATWPVVSGQDRDAARRQRFTHNGFVEDEQRPETSSAPRANEFDFVRPTEAPAAFDNRTNGFSPQGPAFDTIDEDNVVPLRSFNDNRFIFEEAETIPDGLGPTYNAQGCRECHQNVVTGGASQIAEHRTGHMTDGQFFESQGGSLVHSRATDPNIMELVAFEDDVRTFRISTNTLGAGFIEAIANSTLQAIRDAQPASLRGSLVTVPVLEANDQGRFGRFGWKNQHASLESFAADAYLNEMGITTPTLPRGEHVERARCRAVRHGARSRRRWGGRGGVCRLHAGDQGAAPRTDRCAGGGRRAVVRQCGLRRLPRARRSPRRGRAR